MTAGGTGKSPHIEYLIRLLQDSFSVSTLSRGYKRKTSGFHLANEFSTCEEIGDEPLQFKGKFSQVQVAVDENRVRGIQQLIMHCSPDIILLDDAFQHRAIKPGLNILLTDYNRLYPFDFFLPSGRLRESKREVTRADIVVVTKTPERLTSIELKMIGKDLLLLPSQKLFFSYLKYGSLYHFLDNSVQINTEQELFQFRVLLFTGIAQDKSIANYIKEFASELRIKKFPDHHFFNQKDLDELKKNFDLLPGEKKILITTEKDLMRLKSKDIFELIKSWPIFILPIEIDFKSKTEEFNQLILKYVGTNK